jgi:hypothetical protein
MSRKISAESGNPVWEADGRIPPFITGNLVVQYLFRIWPDKGEEAGMMVYQKDVLGRKRRYIRDVGRYHRLIRRQD